LHFREVALRYTEQRRFSAWWYIAMATRKLPKVGASLNHWDEAQCGRLLVT